MDLLLITGETVQNLLVIYTNVREIMLSHSSELLLINGMPIIFLVMCLSQ